MYLLITLICSGVYFFFRDGIDPCLENYREALYFSVVTGTTLGYGDFSPVGGIVRIAAGIQALSGPVLLAFYVSKSLQRQELKRQRYKEDYKVAQSYARVYLALDRFLNEIESPKNLHSDKLCFSADGSPVEIHTVYYDKGRSALAMNEMHILQKKFTLPEEGLFLEAERDKLSTIYKVALSNLRLHLTEFGSVDSSLPFDVSNYVGNIVRAAIELHGRIEGPTPFLHKDGELLWKNEQLKTLKWMQLNTYKFKAVIEESAVFDTKKI